MNRTLSLAIALASVTAACTACTVGTDSNFVNPPPPPPATCATSDVSGCGAGSVGYSCTSDRPDDGDTDYVCSAGRAGAGSTLYCCLPYAQYFTECGPDTTIPGCADPGFGFSCAGPTAPGDADSRLACSAPLGDANAPSYCCVPRGTSEACVAAPTLVCSGASVGFACAGDASPGDGDAPVACDVEGAGEIGGTTRCCVPFLQSPDGCEEDQHAGCPAGSYGFSCAGLHQPQEWNSGLACAASGPSTYCCSLE